MESLLGEESYAHCQRLVDEWHTELRSTFWQPGTLSAKSARQQLQGAFARFNRRWMSFLEQVDRTEVNQLRSSYNQYYLVEKECAIGSYRLAVQNYRELPPVTIGSLLHEFPLLPELV